MRRFTSAAIFVALSMIVVTPAYALPPVEFDSDDFFLAIGDSDNGVAVFWNITPVAFCEWNGDDPPPIINRPVPATSHEGGNGNVFVTYSAMSDLTLVRVVTNGEEFDICSTTEAWASGLASVQLRDRISAEDSGQPHEFATTVHLNGRLTDSSGGSWRYSLVANELFEGDLARGSGLRTQLKSVGG